MRALLWIAISVAAAGCTGRGDGDPAEAQRLMQTSRDWSKAAEAGNMDAVLGYFADDAVLIAEGRPPVRGRDALRAYLAESARIPGFTIRWEPHEAHVSGDLGYLLERTTLTMTGPQGAPVTQQLQAVTVWRRQPDGAWKNVVDASVPAAPQPPAP